MYRVLVVEDEIIVREWLRRRVSWDACGLKVCGEAGNGRDAWEVYQREKPALKSGADAGGVGMMNVSRRIILRYGSPYGIWLEQSEYGGLRTCILLPKLEKSE